MTCGGAAAAEAEAASSGTLETDIHDPKTEGKESHHHHHHHGHSKHSRDLPDEDHVVENF